jgi:membrane protein implicated in regulation of membrane protease activity
MKSRLTMPTRVRLVLAAALCVGASVLTSGCSSVGAASGAAAGVASGLVTANPAIGIGVGIAVQAATDEAVARYMRNMHSDQQNEMAQLAGNMAVGETKPWSVKHKMPIENGHGEVRVTRAFTSALAICKDFVFSVVARMRQVTLISAATRPGLDENTRMRSHISTASSMLCVTISTDLIGSRPSIHRSSRSVRSVSAVSTSSAENGSSISSSVGMHHQRAGEADALAHAARQLRG